MRYNDEFYDDPDDEDDGYSTRKRKKKGGIIGRLLFFIAAVFVAVGTYIGCLGYEMYSRAVTAVPLEKAAEKIRSEENYTSISEIPDFYTEALVAVEDKRYYYHCGFDIRSIGRAVIINLKERRLAEGGSTITQQLAKNVYYTQEKSFIRKAAELFTALDMEEEFTKDEILELYINSIYYGDNCYNIYDASMHYFGIPPSEMNEYQCALLVGIPNAPSVYSPNVNEELSLERQAQVLDAMISAGYITESEKNEIIESGE